MQKIIKITPDQYPPSQGESWWIVHPNNGNVVFHAPIGSVTVCIDDFRDFKKGKVYEISDNNEAKGFITINNKEEIVEMPYYLFAQKFDAEAFVTPAGNKQFLANNSTSRYGKPALFNIKFED